MKRRTFISGSVAMLAVAPQIATLRAEGPVTQAQLVEIRKDWRRLVPQNTKLPEWGSPLTKNEDQWRQELTRAAFDVLFEEDTERPFSSALNHEKRDGIYVCAACDLPLFTSRMKYDSGTGWPSFFTHIPEHLGTKTDFKIGWPRTEYHCRRCEGHQGHVFKDGPQPTRERWCNNGVALKFLPT